MAPAPPAGVWGLAPTLHNVIELVSIVGSVATVSGGPLPLVMAIAAREGADVTTDAGGTGYVRDDAGLVVELLNVSAWSASGCRVPDG